MSMSNGEFGRRFGTSIGRRVHGSILCGKTSCMWNEKRGNFRDGRKDGQESFWFPNGKKEREGEFRNGLPIGTHKIWNADGQQLEQCEFKDGKADGEERHWYGNGQVRFKGKWRLGVLDEAVSYTSRGQDSGRVISGNGVLRVYRPDGSLAGESEWNGGKRVIPPKTKPAVKP